ncbi:Tetratricopeptide repeat protein 39B [Halotydeus destructor]|nr:Tetratricopeptide repeat protein 39B [Halotydeus destructor]
MGNKKGRNDGTVPDLDNNNGDVSSSSSQPSDLDFVLKDVEALVQQFLCNQFEGSMREVEEKKDGHCYYQFVRAYFETVKGVVIFEEPVLDHALSCCHEALAAINQQRKSRNSILKLIWSPDYDDMSDMEAHAEILYATVSGFMCILTLVVEKSLIGLVKTAYRLKSSYDTLRESEAILKRRKSWSSELSRESFKNAVQVLHSFVVLSTSHLPSRVLKLVQFFGMEGSRRAAMLELESVMNANQIWSPMGGLILLSYNTQIEYIVGLGEGNMKLVKTILDRFAEKYSHSGFFMLFAGLLEQISGRPDKAIEVYKDAMTAFEQWPQLNNICYWFMIWSHATLSQWDMAAKYAKIMADTCKWSPCTSTYQYAACLSMQLDDAKDGQDGDRIREQIVELLKMAPKLKHNVAGKTVFLEKFVTKRCQLYFENDETLVLPMLEMFLLWNIFPMMKQSADHLTRFKGDIDAKLAELECAGQVDCETYHYLRFMRGVIWRYLDNGHEAEKDLKHVILSRSYLHSHLAPQACLELGLIYKDMAEYSEARKFLNKARSDYSKYLNETLVHLRVHCALMLIKEREKAQQSGQFISLVGDRLSINS